MSLSTFPRSRREHVTDCFRLGVNQWQVDFIDVDVYGDTRLYLDPTAVRRLPTEWGHECVALIQDFFKKVIDHINAGNHAQARMLLRGLREPNETHLGLSRNRAQGRALGPTSADWIWRALAGSKAVRSGLLVDLEDTVLMVEGIGPDLISDITTNLIREPLIAFSNEMCRKYGIPMREGLASGLLWNPALGEWTQRFVSLPVVHGERKLLLVPKIIVRRHLEYDQDEYFRDYVLEWLAEQEIAAGSSLVKLLKDGTPIVTKKDLIEKFGKHKGVVVDVSREHPDVLDRYRHDKRTGQQRPLAHEDLAETEGAALPEWDRLLRTVSEVPPGQAQAGTYHHAVEQLLTALLYPWLTNPVVEQRIHNGRKRIDVVYWNAATAGFFDWIGRRYPAAHVLIECKNYDGDPSNPELDQLTGRFSPNRGTIGFLVCRAFNDREIFIKRCRDSAADDRGFVLPLDDRDLQLLVEARRRGDIAAMDKFFKGRFDRLVM